MKPALFSLSTVAVLAACTTPYSNPKIVAPPGQDHLVAKVRSEVRDLETQTGKRFRGEVIELRKPVAARYADWRGMPVAKIRGRYQGGLTSWKVLDKHATMYFAHAGGKIPDWLVRHESLHVILLSNGIPGHPRSYSKYFGKDYWWLPEGSLRRGALAGEPESYTEASCCPMCGVPIEELRELRELAP